MKKSDDTFIDKVYLYVKDPEEAKYKNFIKNRQSTGKHGRWPRYVCRSIFEPIDDVYDDINEYNPDRQSNVLIVFDDMICDVIPAKVSELLIRGRKAWIYP